MEEYSDLYPMLALYPMHHCIAIRGTDFIIRGGMNHMRRNHLIGNLLGVLAVLLVLFMAVGVAEEERTDASRQWMCVLKDGGAVVTRYVGEPKADLVIPCELDGVPVTCIGDSAFAEEYVFGEFAEFESTLT
ncbi:MAG: hypothetical protein FWD51_06855, partial [Betaproteobacteria bacterium]|nr:hypothetical protein [Betaproteobacteria bacterium]